MKIHAAFALSVAVASLCEVSALAAGITVGQPFNFKVTASSTGAPCEADCWERWEQVNGLGQVMVVKDSSGTIVESGRISEAYFLDLYSSVDEANRKIPVSAQIVRFGVVKSVVSAAVCTANCTIGVEYGYGRHLMLGIGPTGKLGGSRETDDATFDPRPASGPFDPPSGTECAGPGSRSCSTYINTRPGTGSIPPGVIITIWAEFDALGNFIGWTIQFSDGRPDMKVSFNP